MPQGQNVMTDGPGLKQRARETSAVLNNVSPAPDPVKAVRFEPTPAEKVNSRAKFGDRGAEKRIDTTQMTKPLGSFKKGTPHVPETGVYQLHKGEAVIPAKDNPMSGVYDKITEGMKKPKKVVKEIRTRKAKGGGWIHEHHHTEPAHHPMEEHVSADKDAMMQHMSDHGDMAEPEAEPNMQSASQAQDAAVGA